MSASTSPLPYTGNKSCIVNTILTVMPKHSVYIEPCMGSAEVFFRKSRAEKEILNDYNGDLVNLFRVIEQLDTLASADMGEPLKTKQPKYYYPEMGFSKEDRERIFEDKMWFTPDDGKDYPELYLNKSIVEGLKALTPLQREVIYRNVIAEEKISAIAESLNCSARNVRDIKSRALATLRSHTSRDANGSSTLAAMILIPVGCLATVWLALYFIYLQMTAHWFEVFILVQTPFTLTFVVIQIVLSVTRYQERALRDYWKRLHGERKR